MRKDMIYKLRIKILETYVRITMIGYESKQNALKEGLSKNIYFVPRIYIY